MPGQPPVIAVIMTAYNAESYLEEAVRSVMDQTFRDWEMILVDDCSADRTPEIAARLASEDPRIRVIRNDTNQRAARSRNIGLDNISPSARYVAVMDSDDRCRPDRFRKEYEFLETHPDCALCGSSIALMDETGTVFAERIYPCGAKRIRRMFCRSNAFAHPTVLFRRSVLDRGFRYDPAHRCEDYEMIFQILEEQEGDNLPEILLDYRICSTQQKSVYLRETLLDTLKIQSSRLFRKRFFHPVNLFAFCAEACLAVLPGKLVFLLFRKMYFHPEKKKSTGNGGPRS